MTYQHDRWSDEFPAEEPKHSGAMAGHLLNAVAKSIRAKKPADC